MKTMKSILVLAAICASTLAQAQTFSLQTNVFSAGLGFGSSIGGFTSNSSLPAISLQYERGIAELGPGIISLGGYAGIKSYRYSLDDYSAKWNYTILGARGAYHFTGLEIEKVDLYGGLMLSYNMLKYSDNANSSNINYGAGASGFSAFGGARYYFTEKIAAMAEAGYGVSFLSFGIGVKF